MTESYSIYKSSAAKVHCMAVYEMALEHWPVPFEQLDLASPFGTTHGIVSGPEDAPPLILLHGQWSTATMWSSVIAELSCNHRTYAIDQIDDVGKSIPRHKMTSRLDYAEWLLNIFDQLELRQTDLIGLSYGGFLALNFALYAPDRVKRLCLLCPGVSSLGPPTRRWAIHGIPMTVFPSRLTGQWLVQGLSVRGYQPDNPESQQLVASVIGLRSRIPFRPAIRDEEFRNLNMPVCLLIGDREAMYDPRKAILRARQLIPHIQAELIHDAGHMLNTDQPGRVMDHITRFLQDPA